MSDTNPTSRPIAPSRRANALLLCGAIVLIVAIVSAVLVLGNTRGKREVIARNGVVAVLHLESFVVNLADPEGKAYLRVGIDLGLKRDLAKERSTVDPPTAVVRDAIVGVLTNCRPEEILTSNGKAQLKRDLKASLLERVPDLAVEEIYFTEFLVQR